MSQALAVIAFVVAVALLAGPQLANVLVVLTHLH